MPSQPAQHDITLDSIRMHCLRYPGGAPPLLLLHSLSGNARIFDGLVAAGLTPAFELLTPDMRGRGKTEAPLAGYSLDDGCADLLALLDHFGLAQVAVCGHSFGGLQGLYFAAHHPQRVSHLIMLNAAAEMHPATPFMVAVATARLDKVFPSLSIYRELVKQAPFVNRWYEEMNGFVAADLERIAPTGPLTSSSRSFIATLAALHIYAQSQRDWRRYAAMVAQPALLIQASEPFLMGMPLLTEDKALQTVRLLPQGRYARVSGNHFTMLFGPGAKDITAAITAFVHASA